MPCGAITEDEDEDEEDTKQHCGRGALYLTYMQLFALMLPFGQAEN